METTYRRTFLKAAGATAALSAFPNILFGAPATNAKLKIGLVGCGGRGTGAAQEAHAGQTHAFAHSIAAKVAPPNRNIFKKVSLEGCPQPLWAFRAAWRVSFGILPERSLRTLASSSCDDQSSYAALSASM